ncbi:MauE/DoxX family redox-associated membrane protein [Planomonospora venezuelensis]|uniref:Methylamine utilisation protein MauE domain-containing protein n=1 Tax=Planomonospora venezuelensis TaxID=1999 RepID=A0A841D564_PLAVE|nr:MauE/DoxX family redox-associated membrane protein [Planomonospora venezuelensis]MBB5964619.1 hypothetical protein [Planomonospora venezuelensis]
MTYPVISCSALLALAFTVSAWSKVRGRAAFASFSDSMRGMRLLPAELTRAAAALIVMAEVLIPPLLLFPGTRPAGHVLAAVLLLALSVGIELGVRRRSTVPCRCFGPSSAPLGRRHLVRNAVLLIAAVVGGTATASGDPQPVHPGGAAVALTAAGLLAVLVVRFDDIADLFTAAPRA